MRYDGFQPGFSLYPIVSLSLPRPVITVLRRIYVDALNRFEVGESQLKHFLAEGLVQIEYDIVPLLRKDSLGITDADRAENRFEAL